ncbi:MAG TPA: sulfotransferase [Rhodanobacteraceae bacterium]|nr:sulfotransferase [Rhodanobacteraceae bacterium]
MESRDRAPESDWLDRGRALVLRGDIDAALGVFTAARRAHPESIELAQALAGVLWQSGAPDRAEALLRELLARHPAHTAAAFLLARILKEAAQPNAAASVLRELFATSPQPVGLAIQAIELLDDCGCKEDAAAICENAIAAGQDDARLHAYSAMLHLQLGDFARVRERYEYALAHDARALDWQVANGLAAAQRYTDPRHADFARFRGFLERDDLAAPARASVLFALGKAHDDIGDFECAAAYFREGNRIVSTFAEWPRKAFRRMVAARLDAKPPAERLGDADCVPVFIVGMPRSGTTLVADLLSRHADVCNRGELAWLPHVAGQLAATGRPTRAMLEKAASTYLAQLRRDDAPARFYLDKQPLNFLHLDTIGALFPNARVIHCERNERDTALSIWMQYFAGPEQNFAYDFTDIETVMQASARLIASAVRKGAPKIHAVRYEALAADPAATAGALAAWLGIDGFDPAAPRDASPIATSSLWQVRQPVHTRSIGRWRAYAPYVPELMRFAVGET